MQKKLFKTNWYKNHSVNFQSAKITFLFVRIDIKTKTDYKKLTNNVNIAKHDIKKCHYTFYIMAFLKFDLFI